MFTRDKLIRKPGNLESRKGMEANKGNEDFALG
jgi:hypothetical protein